MRGVVSARRGLPPIRLPPPGHRCAICEIANARRQTIPQVAAEQPAVPQLAAEQPLLPNGECACGVCINNRQHARDQLVGGRAGDDVSADLCGPFTVPALDGSVYAIVYYSRTTGHIYVEGLRSKAAALVAASLPQLLLNQLLLKAFSVPSAAAARTVVGLAASAAAFRLLVEKTKDTRKQVRSGSFDLLAEILRKGGGFEVIKATMECTRCTMKDMKARDEAVPRPSAFISPSPEAIWDYLRPTFCALAGDLERNGDSRWRLPRGGCGRAPAPRARDRAGLSRRRDGHDEE